MRSKQRIFCRLCSESAVAEMIGLKWFARFKVGDSSLDQEYQGRSYTTDEDTIEILVENNVTNIKSKSVSNSKSRLSLKGHTLCLLELKRERVF
ncbi:hypothetical protein TNCV_2386691 [Trichonephila clavipes]|nr:hypothetical protein TNCV_2386691 [Trichonephila clavipes]